MNVIFLDFNGVLDTHENMDVIDPGNLNRLKKLSDMFDAKVVITSSLKKSYYLTGHYNKILQELIDTLLLTGIDVIGLTPDGINREEEIKTYMSLHPEIESYCILDDDYDMKEFEEHLVKMPMQIEENQSGFTQEYLDLAIKIMERR